MTSSVQDLCEVAGCDSGSLHKGVLDGLSFRLCDAHYKIRMKEFVDKVNDALSRLEQREEVGELVVPTPHLAGADIDVKFSEKLVVCSMIFASLLSILSYSFSFIYWASSDVSFIGYSFLFSLFAFTFMLYGFTVVSKLVWSLSI